MVERKDRIDALGGAVLIAFSALLGLNQVMVKLVNAGLQPVFQAGLRSLCAFLPVLIYAMVMRKKLSLTDGSLIPGILCGVFFAVEFLMLFTALDYTSVARASIMFYTMPFWVAVIAHFIIPGERLTVLRIAGLVLAVIGIIVAFADKAAPVSGDVLFGDILCLAAATFWAAIAIVARTTKLSRSSPEMQLLYQLAVSAPILLVASLFFGDLVRELTPVHLGIFTFQVLIVVGVGFLTWFWVLSIYPASDMASFGFLAPLFGVVLGWFILGEAITMSVLLSLTLVGLGIALVNYKPKQRSLTHLKDLSP